MPFRPKVTPYELEVRSSEARKSMLLEYEQKISALKKELDDLNNKKNEINSFLDEQFLAKQREIYSLNAEAQEKLSTVNSQLKEIENSKINLKNMEDALLKQKAEFAVYVEGEKKSVSSLYEQISKDRSDINIERELLSQDAKALSEKLKEADDLIRNYQNSYSDCVKKSRELEIAISDHKTKERELQYLINEQKINKQKNRR